MNKHVFIIVRYSVLLKKSGAWSISRGLGLESYRHRLFDQKRLCLHEKLFKNVALQSIIGQDTPLDENDFTLIVLTSDELPEENRRNLQAMLFPYPWAKICSLGRKDEIEVFLRNKVISFNETTCYATLRLDDDDALSSDFLEKMSQYIRPDWAGYCVSFGMGYQGFFDTKKDKFVMFRERHFPKIAAGLAMINIFDADKMATEYQAATIYGAGSHQQVDRRYPTILDCRAHAFMRTEHEEQDTHYSEKNIADKYKNSVSADVIRDGFSIDDSLF